MLRASTSLKLQLDLQHYYWSRPIKKLKYGQIGKYNIKYQYYYIYYIKNFRLIVAIGSIVE
jgi:hypothetical protein